MSAVRDPWADFAAVFADELAAAAKWTPEQMDAAEAYAREQMASAQSEAAQQAATKEYNRE